MTQQPQLDNTLIDDIIDWYDTWYRDDIARFAQAYPKDRQVFEVSFMDMRRGFPEVAEDYMADPSTVKSHLHEALTMYDLPADIDLSGASIRIVDIEDAARERTWVLGEYLPDEVSTDFIFVRGQVTKATQPKLRPTRAVYECTRCGTETVMQQPPMQPLVEPHECTACERQGPFTPLTDKMAESAVNHQLIRLEPPPEIAKEAGEDRLDVVLEKDLVRACKPGDSVTLATEMTTIVEDGDNGVTLDFMAEADTVELRESDFENIDYYDHKDEIEAIADSVDPYQQIVDSILPSHYGHEVIKEAIAYQLFGGVEKHHEDGSVTRGTVHIFLVGDPGVGKSSLMSYVDKVAPRTVMTTGTGSTSAGLTCAAVQDDFGSGGWTLEAGALVEAHKGLCLIDELDDMADEDQAGLLQAMSEREITVSKAGINARLPANTSVLAAANPKFGRFDRYEPLAQQLDIHDALFSRFDLIFPMADDPDEEFDRKVANQKTRAAQEAQRAQSGGDADHAETSPEIPPETLRAYISYARELTPVFTDEARQLVEEEYVRIRTANDGDGPVPTTARILESITRLSEASARIRLSETIATEDVKRALRLYHEFITQFGIDPEDGEFDADIIEKGPSHSQRERMRRVKAVIVEIEGKHPETGAPEHVILDHYDLDDFEESKIKQSIRNLLDKGEIYEHQADHYRVT